MTLGMGPPVLIRSNPYPAVRVPIPWGPLALRGDVDPSAEPSVGASPVTTTLDNHHRRPLDETELAAAAFLARYNGRRVRRQLAAPSVRPRLDPQGAQHMRRA